MKPCHIGQSGPARPRVQAESRFRVSGEAIEGELVHAAHLGIAQKRAFHVTVHEASKSTAAIAAHAGISYPFLCAAASDTARDQLPWFRLPLVLESSDNLTYLRFLAGLQSATVIPLPSVGATGDLHRASVTMREFAEFIEAGAAASEDAVVSPQELATIEREADDAVRAILELVAHYRARVQRPLLEEK